MTKRDFNQRVNEMCAYVKQCEVDNISNELRRFAMEYGAEGVFIYAHWCERNFEANLREDYKRKTTFTSDFSIAEWCVAIDGLVGIAGTLKRALLGWRDSIDFFAELIIVLNLKSWEHHARGNALYSQMYADLYYHVKHLYFDWYDEDNAQHKKAMTHYFDYVD